MTREEQLRFCKRCLNRAFSPQKGIICNLTSERATFDDNCNDFLVDESAPVRANPLIIKDNKPKPVKVKKPEVLSRDDVYMLLAISALSVFFVRFFFYSFNLYHGGFGIFSFSVTFLFSLILALILRKREQPGFRFLGDLKFKMLYILITAGLNLFYDGFVFGSSTTYFRLFFLLLLVFFILSFISVLIIKPFYWLFNMLLRAMDEEEFFPEEYAKKQKAWDN